MADSYVLINQDYKESFKNYLLIDDEHEAIYEANKIIYDDLIFSQRGEWCLITMIPGDVYCEDVLKKMSGGSKLIYMFADEGQLDCEFVVIQSGKIIRKYFNYHETKELNEDVGKLPFEDKISLSEWYDIDKVIELAFNTPDKIFE